MPGFAAGAIFIFFGILFYVGIIVYVIVMFNRLVHAVEKIARNTEK